ncbi:MFS-type transporter SLC18B1 isoform X4 [Colius striatus]|uniref:MFS-type transporter SLC18B1 isoform X4 n=1 Tax=Colius striatus TaxID=57412 RepID=UPI002B1E4B3D|nr:MFS-type transporter SLC18B1 isoform X4 [Colius striatus]
MLGAGGPGSYSPRCAASPLLLSDGELPHRTAPHRTAPHRTTPLHFPMGSRAADGAGSHRPAEDGMPEALGEESRRFTREQIFTMSATASINFCSMICYSILGPFFPSEAEKKGVSNTVVGQIFGCFALTNFLSSLILGNYITHIGAKFMFVAGMFLSGCVTILFGLLDKVPSGPMFIGFCFLVRSVDAVGYAAAMTASFSILAKAFPSNIATVLFKLSAGYVGLVFLGLALSYSLSSPLLGLLSDKRPYLRKWLLVSGGFMSALWFFMLGPAPVLHIESQLWMFVLMLVLIGLSLGMSIIPVFPEMLHCAYENGFEEGLSLLGLVSGLFNATWSLGAFAGPTLGGFLNEKLGFEWASALQGGWVLLSGLAIGIFYITEATRRSGSSSSLQNPPGSNEERTYLLGSET